VELDWLVPANEWDRFLRYVEAEYGEIEGNVSREVRPAMREWLDIDEFAAVEEKVDRLIQAAGRTPANLGKKNGPSTPRAARRRREFLPTWRRTSKRGSPRTPGTRGNSPGPTSPAPSAPVETAVGPGG
jgi:hypothetical protein